ncbi:GNAT family N-acetyltransferase [Arthrobacter sp. ISL-28]|nr:GNAT family N-acetyltransferase [Arthrobacter sp. ISL-28]
MEDVDRHLAGEDAELVRWFSGGISTRQSVEEYIRRCMDQWEAGGPVHAFGVRAGLGELVGTIEVQFDQPYLQPGTVNISYGLQPAWRGRGIATRRPPRRCPRRGGRGSPGGPQNRTGEHRIDCRRPTHRLRSFPPERRE